MYGAWRFFVGVGCCFGKEMLKEEEKHVFDYGQSGNFVWNNQNGPFFIEIMLDEYFKNFLSK